MSSMLDRFYKRSAHLNALLNSDPAEAVKQAREINLASHILANWKKIDLLEVIVSLRLAQAVVEDDLAVEPLLVETERCGVLPRFCGHFH